MSTTYVAFTLLTIPVTVADFGITGREVQLGTYLYAS